MSRKDDRRKERDAAWAIEQEAINRELARKEALDMWNRIHESDASEDVKDILHRLARHVGLEA